MRMKKVLYKKVAVIFAVLLLFAAGQISVFAVVGDIDQNGRLQSADARLLLRYSVGMERLSETVLQGCDVSYDDRINTADARLLLRAALRIDSLDYYDRYYMHANFTNSATGTVTTLDTAWMDGQVLIYADAQTALIYDGDQSVALVNDALRQYSVLSFSQFQREYPGHAGYFANGAEALCWSENLPTPLFLRDQGFTSTSQTVNGRVCTVYRKQFSSGYQSYAFDSTHMPVKSEFFADGSLMTLDFLSFSRNPYRLFTDYLSYTKVN